MNPRHHGEKDVIPSVDRKLLEEVLRLKPSDRMRLLDAIYRSLERPDQEIDELWYDEAERRLAAFKAGGIQGTSADQVLGEQP